MSFPLKKSEGNINNEQIKFTNEDNDGNSIIRLESHQLTPLEHLNVLVDDRAQTYSISCRTKGLRPTDGDIFGEIGSIRLHIPDRGRLTIYQEFSHTLHNDFHAARIRQHWVTKGGLSGTAAADVDWDALRRADSKRSIA